MLNILDYLELSIQRFPDKVAFSDEAESITFLQLYKRAKAVGTYIAKKLKVTKSPVAVLTGHRAVDIVYFLGVVYSGNFYVPIDANAPAEFLEKRYSAIKPMLILPFENQSENQEAYICSGFPDEVRKSEPPEADIDEALLLSIRSKSIDMDPVYSIFTSGSTGLPKAAVICHRSVINLTDWLCDTFGFSENTVFAGQNMFYFDASVKEIYSTLKCGCTTHILPKKLFVFPHKIPYKLDELGVNVLPWSTAAVKLLANSGAFDKHTPKHLTDVIFGGENMPAKQLNIWRRAMPKVRYTNVYGPTEITVDCCYYTVERDFADDESIPIGSSCRNTEILLLDGDRPAREGELGEIAVRGTCVGLGYYGNDDITAKAFVQNPLNPYYRDIIYRTGDLGRINSHGELVCQSRADGQIKHMGNRIELGEIEAAAAGIDGIDLVCCSYDYDKQKILMFYTGCAESRTISIVLSERLPRYMCPSIVIRVDKMPETPNGKIDRIKVRKEYYDTP